MKTNITETEAYPRPTTLGEIGVDRRAAIHMADAEYEPLREKANKALQFACSQLGLFVLMRLKEFIELAPNLGVEAAEFRRLLDELEKRTADEAESYIALQAEHEKIEDKYDRLTAEYYAKNPVQQKGN